MGVKINNAKDYMYDCKYIVARCNDGELWFYGADDSETWAKAAAKEVDGFIFINNGGVIEECLR